MYQQHSKTGKEPQSKQINSSKTACLPAVYIGASDITGGRQEATTSLRSCETILPTMEDYFLPETDPPLEFNNSSQSLTDTIDRILDNNSRRDLSNLTWEQRQTVLDYEEVEGFGVGACLNIFPSGEITGGCYSRGNKRAPGHTGKIRSMQFTKQARKKIRRAVDCKITNFKLFVTLTFDPKISKLNVSGSVDQEWAKERFKQFLNTVKKKYDRLADKTQNDNWRISYIWVAEIQEMNTNNIHFHILVDRPFIDSKWLVKIWGQAANSVNIKRLNNQEHAVNYMLKYMKKGNCPIEGKRYGMTQNLIEGSKPIKYDFYGRNQRNQFLRIKEEFEWQIKQNGGYVADWGVSVPPPKRIRLWRDKNGNVQKCKGTSQKVSQDFLKKIGTSMFEQGVPINYDNNLNKLVELPF